MSDNASEFRSAEFEAAVTEGAPTVAELLNLGGRVALGDRGVRWGVGAGDAQRLLPGYKTAR
jgi:hypothetical protein